MAESNRRPPAAVALAIAVLAALALALALTACGGKDDPSGSDPLAGYWLGTSAREPVLVHIVKDGEAYQVRANADTTLGKAVRAGNGLVLDTHAVKMTFTPSGTDALEIRLTGSAFKKTRVIALTRADETKYADAATIYGVAVIRRGIMMWAGSGTKHFPPAAEVQASGVLGKMVVPWPVNMFENRPMQPGAGAGDYTYTLTDGGKRFTLVGHLSDGGTTIGK